jgi:uncharacterized protein
MRALLLLAVTLLSALLSGCGSSSTPTRYYVLTPLASAPPAEKRDVSVVIAGVRLPQYLDRPQIITRGGDNRLQVSDFDQWGGNLRQDMTRVLAENLGRLLGSDRVAAAPYAPRTQPDFRVEVEVLRFERAPDGRVQLAAKWWLTRGDGSIVASPNAELSGAPLAAETGSYDGLVASMSAVYNELALAIAEAIRARGKT